MQSNSTAALRLDSNTYGRRAARLSKRKFLESSPLSSGEQILLRCAFDLWNGAGKVLLYRDILGRLDPARTQKLLLLVMGVNCGRGSAVDEWIARKQRKERDLPTC